MFKTEDFEKDILAETIYGDVLSPKQAAKAANAKVRPLLEENAKLKLELEIWKQRVIREQELTEEFRKFAECIHFWKPERLVAAFKCVHCSKQITPEVYWNAGYPKAKLKPDNWF